MMRFAITDSSDDENLDSVSTGILYPEIVTGVWSDFGGFMNSSDKGIRAGSLIRGEGRDRQMCLSLPRGIVVRHLHLRLRRSRKLVFIYFPLLKSFDIILKQLNNKCSHSFTYQFL